MEILAMAQKLLGYAHGGSTLFNDSMLKDR